MHCFLKRKGKDEYYSLNSSELDHGISLAIKKAKEHLDVSKLLVNNEQFLSYSSALFLFALEEYGKSKLLRKAKSPTKSIHLVNRNIFKDGNSHRRKIEEGRKDLTSKTIQVQPYIELEENSSEETRTISLIKDIKVSIGPNQSGTFADEGNTNIQEEIRWKTFYLDWDDSQRYWISGYHIKKDELLKLIAELENCLN
jgi:AbiV family abortive infection protein